MNHQEMARPVDILLVEDNPADVRLTREALREGKVRNNLHVMQDGQEALDFLFQKGRYTQAPRPDIVLLDLNLPKKDGREVLAEIKSSPRLRTIPVTILTISKAEEDVLKTYEHHANCYIIKPIDMDQFLRVMRSVEDFWLEIVKLPPKQG